MEWRYQVRRRRFSHNAIVAAELPLPGAQGVGDVDQDGDINVSDAVLILQYLYHGGWRPRRRVADVDSNGVIELTDAIRLLEYLFLGGKPPG